MRDWLELRSLVRVDSAVCNHQARLVLLKLFSCNICTQERIVNLNTESCAQWFCKRKVPLTQVGLEAGSQEISKCLRLNSKSISSVNCFADDAIDLAAMDCRNLTFFACEDLAAKPNLNAVLICNVNLQELRLEDVKELQVSHFDNVRFPHIKAVSLYNTPCDDALLIAVIDATVKLQHLNIGRCGNITDEGLIAVAKHCPHLRSIGLDKLPITDTGLTELTRLCPLIDLLRLHENDLITDSGVLSAVKYLAELKTFHLSNCDITDLSLKHLAQNSASTLQNLCVYGMEQVRVDTLVRLLQQCRELRTLIIDCDIDSYCTDIVPHMCNLQSLLVYGVLSDDCICMIARHCKQLQHLGIPCSFKVDSATAASVHPSALEGDVSDVRVMHCAEKRATKDDIKYTEIGLLSLVDGLSNLQRLYCPAVSADDNVNTLLHIMVQRMWQRLRPGLQFEHDDLFFHLNALDHSA